MKSVVFLRVPSTPPSYKGFNRLRVMAGKRVNESSPFFTELMHGVSYVA